MRLEIALSIVLLTFTISTLYQEFPLTGQVTAEPPELVDQCVSTSYTGRYTCSLSGGRYSDATCNNACGETTQQIDFPVSVTSESQSFPFSFTALGTSCSFAVVNTAANSISYDTLQTTTVNCNTLVTKTIEIGEGKSCSAPAGAQTQCTIVVVADDTRRTHQFTVLGEVSSSESQAENDVCQVTSYTGRYTCSVSRGRYTNPTCDGACGSTPDEETEEPALPTEADEGVNFVVRIVDLSENMNNNKPTGTLNLKVVVRNNGDENTPNSGFISVAANITDSSGKVVCEAKAASNRWISYLAAGAEQEVYLSLSKPNTNEPCNLAKGTYKATIVVDAEHNYEESDEQDNTITSSAFGTQGAAGQNCPSGVKEERLEGTVFYCDKDGTRQTVKENGEKCSGNNHYECESNICAGVCLTTCTGQFSGKDLTFVSGTSFQSIYCNNGEMVARKPSGSCTVDQECLSNICVMNGETGTCVNSQGLTEEVKKNVFCSVNLLPASLC